MTTQNQPKKDDEPVITTIVMAIFALPLIAVDIWYSDWHGMIDTWAACGLIGALVGHAVVLLSGFIAYKEFNDPNFEFSRKVFCVAAVLTLLYVGAFRAGKNEAKSVIDDSNAKQEQTK